MKNGLYCTGGHDWVSVDSNGDVHPCLALFISGQRLLGNLFTGDLVKLRKQPYMRCPIQECQQVCDRHWSAKKIYRDDKETDSQDLDNPLAYQPFNHPISILWAPSWVCSYNCRYCALPKDKALKTEAQWTAGFGRFLDDNRIDGGLLHTHGGEPLDYKGMAECLAFFAERGFVINVTTNLSSDIWGNFMNVVQPEQVGAINCSLHACEPKFNWNMFRARVLALKLMGYPVSVSLVGHPDQLALAPEFHEYFAKEGIPFALIPMSGSFDGFGFNRIADYPPGLQDILLKYSPLQLRDRNKFLAGERAG